MKTLSTTLACLAVLAGAGGQASAATVTREYFSHGTANCQSALQTYDAHIRKRPLAVANEGADVAFVTCDSDSIDNFGAGHEGVAVFFKNRAGAADIVVDCTLADGIGDAFGYFPKSTTPIPAGEIVSVVWSSEDNGDQNFVAPAMSCALPPGVDIIATVFVYPEEIGAPAP